MGTMTLKGTTFSTVLDGGNPTATRTVTFPDKDFVVAPTDSPVFTGPVVVPNALADNQSLSRGQLDQVLHVREEQAAGVAAGASVAGNQVRVLNTVVRNTIVGASLATNQITLPAGKYSIFASAPAFEVDKHRARLVNVTDSVVVMLGTGMFAYGTYYGYNNSIITGIFSLTATKILNITHYTATAVATYGLGLAVADNFIEVYTSVYITKIG